MGVNVNVPVDFGALPVSFTVGCGTNAKVIIDTLPASGAWQGGCRIIDGTIVSTDPTNAQNMLVYIGRALTVQDATTTGNMALTASTITRATTAPASFLTDGWSIGDTLMVFGPQDRPNTGLTTATNIGKLGQVTAVAAGTLTVNGTVWTAEALPAGARIVRVGQRTWLPIPAASGNAAVTKPVTLMGGGQDPSAASQPDTGWEIGAGNMLIMAMVAALPALPVRIDVTPIVARR